MQSPEFQRGLINGDTYFVASQDMDGRPPLLLFMGYSGTTDSWSDEFLATIARAWPLIAVDLPGNGRGTRSIDKDRLSYPAVARDVAAILDHFGVEAAHILGYSYGGTIAMSVASQLPTRVRSLVLVATTLGGRDYISPPREILAALGAPAGETIEEKTEAIWRICLGEDKMPQFRERMLATLDRQRESLTPGWVLREQLKNYLSFSFAAEASELDLPSLVVTGAEDPLTPAENSRRIAAVIPGAVLLELDGCRHMPHLEDGERFAAAVLAFLRRTAS